VTIKGVIIGPNKFRPKIGRVQLAENIVERSENGGSVAEIKMTPVITVEQDNSYDGRSVPFNITQELVLESMNWGRNTFHVLIGDVKTSVTVHQAK